MRLANIFPSGRQEEADQLALKRNASAGLRRRANVYLAPNFAGADNDLLYILRLVFTDSVLLFEMCALESAFVNSVITGERDKGLDVQTVQTSCAQQGTTEKKISGLKMWRWKSVERGKSGYDFLEPSPWIPQCDPTLRPLHYNG